MVWDLLPITISSPSLTCFYTGTCLCQLTRPWDSEV